MPKQFLESHAASTPETSSFLPPARGVASAAVRGQDVEGTLSALAARVVGTGVPRDVPLMEAGVDSLAASELV